MRKSLLTTLGSLALLTSALWAPLALAQGSPAFDRVLAPTSGTINNLVVFIRFSDQPEFAQPLSYYEGLFNSAHNSLKNFYLENSYNAVTVNSTFYPTSNSVLVSYRDTHPTTYYQAYDATAAPDGYVSAQSTAREAALVTHALAAISAQIPAGLDLDTNDDGFVDHVTFEVYSSTAHPLPVLFHSRATYDTTHAITLRGKKVGAYTWVSASQDAPGTGTALGATEIHEMGHSFGYPDTRTNSGRQAVGDWDVMANATRVVHSGAYMKYRFTHWIANIPEITAYGTYTLNDLTQATHNSYKLPLPNSNEFLILEYRKASGTFEGNLPGSGLCITRVNESAGVWGNLGGPPFFLYYYRKDGTLANDGSGNAWNACLSADTGRVQLTDTSNPSCFLSDGSGCGISIIDVGTATGPSISFSVTAPGTAPVTRSISGILTLGGSRVSGATLTLGGDTAASTTTDSLGNYTFVVADGGDYTLTPSKPGLSFSPAQASFTDLTSDRSQHFTAINDTNTLSGTVTWGGAPLAGITVACNSGCTPQLATTSASGAYSFTVNAGSSYDVYPAGASGYYFSPSSKTFDTVIANQTHNFTAQAITSTTLVSAPNPGTTAQSVTFTATVSGGAPAGNVTFSSSGIVLCTAPLMSNGKAQCVANALAAGNHGIIAAYTGNSSHASSTSDLLAQVVTQAELVVQNGATLSADAGIRLTLGDTGFTALAGTEGARVSFAAAGSDGLNSLAVDSGAVTLETSFDAATLPGGRVHAGEIARFGADGNVVNVRLGSLAGSGSAGDPLPLSMPDALTLEASVPDLTRTLSRLEGATLLPGFAAVIALETGLAITTAEQHADGVLHLRFGGGAITALPVGAIRIDTARADGISVSGNRIDVTRAGLVSTVVPSVGSLADFAAHLAALSADGDATIAADGTLHVALDGATYVMQPGWLSQPTGAAAGIHARQDGYVDYVDATGNAQVLYPAFADLEKLTATFRAVYPDLVVTGGGNGSFVATIGTQRYTLLPDYTLAGVPAAHAGDAWWQDADGKFFIRYNDDSVQGFGVK